MADDTLELIPLNQVPPAKRANSSRIPQSRGMFGRIDDTLNSIFGPINRGMASIGMQPQSPVENLMMALSAIAPGRGMMAPKMPLPNQPRFTPNSQDLIFEMLANNAGPRVGNTPIRGNTFSPMQERAMAPSDTTMGTRVLTPANRSPAEEYNLALMRRLNINPIGGGGQ